MIVGTGTDIIEVERVEHALTRDGLKEKIFSEREQAYCNQGNSVQCYAARFAAKEAFFKALGTGWRGKMKITEVEVLNDDLGKPFIELSGSALELFQQRGGRHIHLSLSHIKQLATAFVVIEG